MANCVEMTDDLELYEQLFAEMLETDSTEMISNASSAHAIVLIRQLICHAERRVDVFCKALSEDVWGDGGVLAAIREASSRGVSFVFVTQEQVSDGMVLKALHECDNIRILKYRFASPNSNFVLVDDQAFRFEPDSSVRKGFAFAKAPESATALKTAFGDIVAASDEISWRV